MASKPLTDPDTEAAVESEDTTPHGATDPDQAMKYIQALDDTMEKMEANAKKEMAHDVVRENLEEI